MSTKSITNDSVTVDVRALLRAVRKSKRRQRVQRLRMLWHEASAWLGRRKRKAEQSDVMHTIMIYIAGYVCALICYEAIKHVVMLLLGS